MIRWKRLKAIALTSCIRTKHELLWGCDQGEAAPDPNAFKNWYNLILGGMIVDKVIAGMGLRAEKGSISEKLALNLPTRDLDYNLCNLSVQPIVLDVW